MEETDRGEPIVLVDATTPSAPAEDPAAEATGVALIVRSWFNDHIANSPVSRSVEAINHLDAALPALIGALTKG